MITGLDALALVGMTRMPSPSGPVHLLVPDTSRRTRHGIALLERTGRLPAAAQGRWPLAPPARAVLDACRRMRVRDHVRATIAEAVQTGRRGEVLARLRDARTTSARRPFPPVIASPHRLH